MYTYMEKTFVRVRSAKDVVAFVSLIIIGTVLVVLPTDAGVNIAGFCMVFAGIILAFTLKSDYMEAETRVRYRKREHYFQQAMHPVISSALVSKPESIDLEQANKGTSVKLDIYYNEPSGQAYLQLFEYIPHSYEPCSELYEHDVRKVEKLIK